jgi:hypothetical protein
MRLCKVSLWPCPSTALRGAVGGKDRRKTVENMQTQTKQTKGHGKPELPIGEDSKTIALRALINRTEHLIKEMEFAFDDVPAGVDAQMSMVRLAIADARQQL